MVILHRRRPRRISTDKVNALQKCVVVIIAMAMATISGCGTTRMSDTLRTGTEQLLLSAAIDRSVNQMDFDVLEGKDVYFDAQYLKGVSDEGYIVSSIRQRLLAEGVFLKSNRDDATYVVEARAGAVGTNRQDVLIGIPQTSLPAGALAAGVPSVIPEIPFAKKTQQKGVAKIAVFAYNQVTGQALWQSGIVPITADARDTWVLGTGPYQRGSIYNGSSFLGQRMNWPWTKSKSLAASDVLVGTPVNSARLFPEDPDVVPPRAPVVSKEKKDDKVVPALFTPAVPPSLPQPGRIPSTVPPSSTAPSATSGFNSSTFNISGATDAQGSSGGNAAAAGAAGMLLYKNSASKAP
jgi:hypothetical protein